jgi:hypothetical protein
VVADDVLMKQHEGYGADYHQAELHPLTDSGGKYQVEQPIASDTSNTLFSQSHERGNGSTVRKPKFLDRVKGEAKIIAGKLGGNDEKIEEGMRLKGKEM